LGQGALLQELLPCSSATYAEERARSSVLANATM